jgi:hypothetical protein
VERAGVAICVLSEDDARRNDLLLLRRARLAILKTEVNNCAFEN